VVAYWLGGAIPAAAVRAHILLSFFVPTPLPPPTSFVGGLLTGTVLGLALLTGPVYAAGLGLGARLFGRADERVFRRICYALIAAAAVLGLPALDPFIR